MKESDRLEKIEKQLELMMLKVDIMYNKIVYNESILNKNTKSMFTNEFYNEAKKLVIKNGKASATLLQRRLGIGYARAAQLLDAMEDQGIIGEADGSNPRDVLVSK